MKPLKDIVNFLQEKRGELRAAVFHFFIIKIE